MSDDQTSVQPEPRPEPNPFPIPPLPEPSPNTPDTPTPPQDPPIPEPITGIVDPCRIHPAPEIVEPPKRARCDVAMTIRELWKRIEDWHHDFNDMIPFRLAPPASPDAIQRLESLIGFPLPDDVRESFLVHNGTDGTLLLASQDILSIEEIMVVWSDRREWYECDGWGRGEYWSERAEEGLSYPAPPYEPCNGRVKPIWWNPLRIPITGSYDSSDPVMLDFDPTSEGAWGQLIKFDHNLGNIGWIAASWRAWLERLIGDLYELR